MRANYILCLFLGLLLPWQLVMAQGVPIVEAGGDSTRNQPAQPAATNNQNEVLVNMYLQLEALQNEVQNLRGQVEEQSYQIRRMQTEQRDCYLDTDSRLVELQDQIQGNPGSGQALTQTPGPQAGQDNQPTPAVTGAANPPGNTAQDAGNPTTVASIPMTEQEIYRKALALLLDDEAGDEAYQDSVTLFQQYLDVYPQGRYYTNSLYWQGAALDLVGNYNRSIEVLMKLIDNYPKDAKAPTAMLRLGTVYRKMGQTAEAVATWQRIGELYPDSTSEIKLANEYLGDVSNN